MVDVYYDGNPFSYLVQLFYQFYNGQWLTLAVLAASVLFCFWQFKGEARRYYCYVVLALVLTVYNPLFIMVMMDLFSFTAEYYRFLWLIPSAILTTYTIYSLVTRPQKKAQRMAVAGVFLIIFVLVFPGEYFSQRFTPRPGIYRIPTDLMNAITVIKEDRHEENPVVTFPTDYNFMARQYDASIFLALERNRMLYALGIDTAGGFDDSDEDYRQQKIIIDAVYLGKKLPASELKAALNYTGTDYLVVPQDTANDNYLVGSGCQVVARTENSVIYRYSSQ